MKHTALILLLAATAATAGAQTAAKTVAPKAAATKPAATAAKSTVATVGAKLPPGVPVVKGLVKTAFTLRYQDIKLGTGADAEANKLYKVHYTGWLADTGFKFDSSFDHPRPPLKDKDGKPVLDADGKPKLDEPQPIIFPQGMGRVIPGFDQGFNGMKIGGKRRLFIPWQLAYGAKGHPTGDPKNPGIPAKADLIFDVELVAQDELPTAPNHSGMGGMSGMPGHAGTGTLPTGHPAISTHLPTPDAPAAPATPAAPAAPATAPAPPATAAPAQPQSK